MTNSLKRIEEFIAYGLRLPVFPAYFKIKLCLKRNGGVEEAAAFHAGVAGPQVHNVTGRPLRTDFSSARNISSVVTLSWAVTTEGFSPRATQLTK